MSSPLKILFVGDLIGDSGCDLLQRKLPALREKYSIDAVIINGENSAPDGRGITPRQMAFFKELSVDVVTTGNHVWDKREIYPYFAEHKDLLRPLNFPSGCPGLGVAIIATDKGSVGVVNLQGRVFMRELTSCPFRALDSALTFLQSRTNCVVVDIHAEATAEKAGLGYYADGRVSAVIGTHSHIQTADARILPEGTAYITDVGMCGALNSMIGMKKDSVLNQMLTQMPTRFVVETEGPMVFNAVVISVDAETGKAVAIERLYVVDEKG